LTNVVPGNFLWAAWVLASAVPGAALAAGAPAHWALVVPYIVILECVAHALPAPQARHVYPYTPARPIHVAGVLEVQEMADQCAREAAQRERFRADMIEKEDEARAARAARPSSQPAEAAPQSTGMCCICMAAECNVACYPCGHISSCEECLQRCSECPICREDIEEVIRVYVAGRAS